LESISLHTVHKPDDSVTAEVESWSQSIHLCLTAGA